MTTTDTAVLTAIGAMISAATCPPTNWVSATVNRYSPATSASGPEDASALVNKWPILSDRPVDASAVPIGSMPAISTTTRHSIDR